MPDPITVGGGGSHKHGHEHDDKTTTAIPAFCEFDESSYKVKAGNNQRFENPNVFANQLKVFVGGVTYDLSNLLPANGECLVHVSVPGGGQSNDLNVNGQKSMGVDMNPNIYKKVMVGNRHNANVQPTSFVITVAGLEISHNIQPGEEWSVTLDHA